MSSIDHFTLQEAMSGAYRWGMCQVKNVTPLTLRDLDNFAISNRYQPFLIKVENKKLANLRLRGEVREVGELLLNKMSYLKKMKKMAVGQIVFSWQRCKRYEDPILVKIIECCMAVIWPFAEGGIRNCSENQKINCYLESVGGSRVCVDHTVFCNGTKSWCW